MRIGLINRLRGAHTAVAIPVVGADELVRGWRADGRVVDDGALPLHITLIWPFMPKRRLSGQVLDELRALAAQTKPFDYQLVSTARFPGVLYLTPQPAAPFVRLTRQLAQRWPRYPPYGGRFADIVPHVTVMQGPDADVLDAAGLDALLPIASHATEMIIAAPDPHGSWHELQRLPLAAATSR